MRSNHWLHRVAGGGCALLACNWFSILCGAEVELKPDSMPRDAEAGLKSITVPDGYEVELVAAEPEVLDPVAFDWDVRGNLWVVEMADYPMGMDGKGKVGGRVRFLEDRDWDGRYEHSRLFAEGLSFPTGILTWREGVIVTAAPDVLFLRDTNGDGTADEREVLLTGLSQGNQQLRANGLRWGLDNWVYVAAGGHHGKYPAGTVVRSSRNRSEVEVGSRDFRFRPDTGVVEPQSGPTQFGRNRDDWGRWFGTQNARPLWHYVLPDHYLRRNPHYAAPEGRVQLPGPIQPPVYPTSAPQKRYHGFDHKGRYTSACSGMIYRDAHLFPSTSSGRGGVTANAFACEPFHNVVQRIELRPEGVTFSGKRGGVEGAPDFFASNDRWCRPVMVRTGPDGALWVADMYRYMIEHPQWLPKKGKQELLPFYRAGDDRGRIYRVKRKGGEARKVSDLTKLNLTEFLYQLGSPNGWVRDKVQQMVLWEGNKKMTRPLEGLVIEAGPPVQRLHALWTMEGLDTLSPNLVVKALADPDPGIRENALQLAEARATPKVVAAALKLANDSEPRVRLQLAFSLGAFQPSPETGETLAKLLIEGQDDPYLIAAVFSSALPHLERLTELLSEVQPRLSDQVRRPLIDILLGSGRTESLREFLTPIFAAASRSVSVESVDSCVELLDRLARRGHPLEKLSAGTDDLSEAISEVTEKARRLLDGDGAATSSKIAAAAWLSRVQSDREEALEFLGGSLGAAVSPTELEQALAALGGTADPSVPARIFAAWPGLSPAGRGLALDVLLSRSEWTRALLQGLEKDTVRAADLDASRRMRLRNHPEKKLKEEAARFLGEGSSKARVAVVEEYRTALVLKGDRKRGEQVYRKACAACHKRGKDGLEVGPDLSTVVEHPPEKLLANILDPNLDIQPGFHAYNCELKDGRKLFGMLASENASSITLKLPDASTRAILRTEIAKLSSANVSLMPEGLEAGLTKQDVADLIALLKSRP